METVLYDSSGGTLGLNFLNTRNWILSEDPEELLNTYNDFLLWSYEAGTIDTGEREAFAAQAANDPARAGETIQAVRATRDTLYAIVAGLVAGEQPDARDLYHFNQALGRALSHRRLELSTQPIRWVFQAPSLPLDYPLWPVLLAAADFFVSADVARVHLCANPTCGWVFLDRSRNGTRKWCSSTSCGNRERVRQYYARKH